MGSTGYRMAQGAHRAHMDIINKETKFLLCITGHDSYDGVERFDQKRSMIVPFKSLEGITEKTIKEKVKEFQRPGNVVEGIELYRISLRKEQKELAGIEYPGWLHSKAYPNLVKDYSKQTKK